MVVPLYLEDITEEVGKQTNGRHFTPQEVVPSTLGIPLTGEQTLSAASLSSSHSAVNGDRRTPQSQTAEDAPPALTRAATLSEPSLVSNRTGSENGEIDLPEFEEPADTVAPLPNGISVVAAAPDSSESVGTERRHRNRKDHHQQRRNRKMSAFERVNRDIAHDPRTQKEITLGKRIGFYRLKNEIGSGNFSKVMLAVHALTKEKVAIKILDKTKLDPKTQRLLSREIGNMERLHHPNIIRLYEVVETLTKLHLVMEYCGGGELFSRVTHEGRIAEPEAQRLYSQVVAAVSHMHERHIIHRDLKAENVFFATPSLVKVGDLGFSTYSLPTQTLNTFCGSPPYAAPELFRDESYVGTGVDIWALGILLYFIITGVMPFRADTVGKLKRAILEGVYNIPESVSDTARFLIRKILRPIPADRFSLQQIINSSWLKGEVFPRAMTPYDLTPRVIAPQEGSSEGQGPRSDRLSSTTEHGEYLSDDQGGRTGGNTPPEVVQQVHEQMRELGITADLIKQAEGKEARHQVTGTYRILLHKVQKQKTQASLFDPEGGLLTHKALAELAAPIQVVPAARPDAARVRQVYIRDKPNLRDMIANQLTPAKHHKSKFCSIV